VDAKCSRSVRDPPPGATKSVDAEELTDVVPSTTPTADRFRGIVCTRVSKEARRARGVMSILARQNDGAERK
jgi:hypothetical protein